jgi:hypothetical protein
MPNSRIEAAFFLDDNILEKAGAWTTNGNTLLAGGGDVLGSLDFVGWKMVTSGAIRAGFTNDGQFYLSEGNLNAHSRRYHLIRTQESINNTPLTIFSFNIPDNRVFKFSADVNFITDDGLSWGNVERKMTSRREGALVDNSKETTEYTERFGNKSIEAYWERSGNLMELKVKGLNGQATYFSSYINYFGA